MQAIHTFFATRKSPPKQAVFLSFFWLSGLVLGAMLSLSHIFYSSLMRSALYMPVSIVNLASSVFLSFIISAFAVYTHRYCVVYFVCFAKSASFGFCMTCLHTMFGIRSWIVCFLLLSSDALYQCGLFWFWLRSDNGNNFRFRHDFNVCAVLAVCSILLNYMWFIPILGQII